NAQLQNQARKGFSTQNRRGKSWTSILFKGIYNGVVFAFVAAGLASLGYYGPKYYSPWQQFQGKRLVEKITANASLTKTDTFSSAYRKAQKLFSDSKPDSLSEGVKELSKALALKPESPEIVSKLAEGLTELGAQTVNRLDLEDAKKLVEYAKALDPQSGD